MAAESGARRTTIHQPALAAFAAAGSVWVFLLVTLGAFTTSINAGMAFPDWPLSNGSINPEGWLSDLSMFAEHSHRLTGAVMGLITIGLAVWLWRREERAWLRRLGYWALGIVILQGIIGGKRVLLHELHVPGITMSVGEMLRIPHGILAQVYVCLLIGIAVALSRRWIETSAPFGPRVRRAGIVCCLLLLAQLAIADPDGTVRVGGAEILGRLVREADPASVAAEQARAELRRLQQDADHRVVAAALNGLQH